MIFHVETIADTSPDSASTAAGSVVRNLKRFEWFTIDAALVGATGGTLDVYLQRDVNGTWVDWYHFPQLSAGGSAVRYIVDSNHAESSGPVTVGSGSSPALADSTLPCAHPGDMVRALYVAGASTSAGAAVAISITCHRYRE